MELLITVNHSLTSHSSLAMDEVADLAKCKQCCDHQGARLLWKAQPCSDTSKLPVFTACPFDDEAAMMRTPVLVIRPTEQCTGVQVQHHINRQSWSGTGWNRHVLQTCAVTLRLQNLLCSRPPPISHQHQVRITEGNSFLLQLLTVGRRTVTDAVVCGVVPLTTEAQRLWVQIIILVREVWRHRSARFRPAESKPDKGLYRSTHHLTLTR